MFNCTTTAALVAAAALASVGMVLADASTSLGADTGSFHTRPARHIARPAAPTPTPLPEPAPAPAPAPEPVPQSIPEPEPAPPQPEPVEPPTITLYPSTGIYSQAAIDTGGIITWSTSPLIVAGHDYAGWDYIDDLAIGTRVYIGSGPGIGLYEVTGSYDLYGKDHYIDAVPYADLILQTCTDWGLGFSLATRVN